MEISSRNRDWCESAFGLFAFNSDSGKTEGWPFTNRNQLSSKVSSFQTNWFRRTLQGKRGPSEPSVPLRVPLIDREGSRNQGSIRVTVVLMVRPRNLSAYSRMKRRYFPRNSDKTADSGDGLKCSNGQNFPVRGGNDLGIGHKSAKFCHKSAKLVLLE
jgi:hypothetical protein